MLQIDLRSLDPGYHSLNLKPAPAELGFEPGEFRDILVEVGFDYDGKQVVVTITVSAVAALVCDRSLVDFEQVIRGEYTVLFSSSDAEEDSEIEIRSFSSTDDELDITDIVRDTLLLSVPVKKIAPGADEMEIPVAFGKPEEEDVDPRWEALKALKNVDGDEDSPRK